MNSDSLKISEATRLFSDYLERKHKRSTPERFIVLRSVLDMKGHFSVEDICERLEGEGIHLAVATVYSTVSLLVDAGVLCHHHLQGDNVFETQLAPHHHAVCTVCGKIRDLKGFAIDQQLRALAVQGFTPTHCELVVLGECSTCTRRRKSRVSSTKNKRIIK